MDEISYHYEAVVKKTELDIVEKGHIAAEAENGIVCNYALFYIAARDKENHLVGLLTAYTAFAEIYVEDLWVHSNYRKHKIGSTLLETLENQFKGKGYNNINLVTSAFQAPEFYKKCGYEVEFVRENKHHPKLTKTFFIKYFEDDIQHQGIIPNKIAFDKKLS
ncbi:GNAT family N-acetyltransferase [Legionella cherrii]|uniref:GNAT family N-acetyltransferase n=1 Tax=Legionella cherrii TaxID=28084 RepID=UPI000687B13F|nr:GNAT family N-acetyltransferase [Legionella cherrii]